MRFTVSLRIYLLAAFLVLLTCIVAAIGVTALSSLGATLEEVSRVNSATTNLLLAGLAFDGERRDIAEFQQTHSEDAVSRLRGREHEASARFDEADALITVHADGFGRDRKDLIATLKRQTSSFADAAEAVVAGRQTVVPDPTEVGGNLRHLIQLQSARGDSLQQQADASAVRQTRVLGGIVVFVVLLGAGVSFLLVRGIVRPLRAMTGAMARLAGGDASIEVAGTDRNDEIGDMARALDIFRANADKIVAMMRAEEVTREIGEVISAAATGDLTRRVRLEDKQGFLLDIGGQVNQLLETSEDAMRDFGGKARQTATSVNEASLAVGQVSEGARAQMSTLTQVALALNESATAMRDVATGTRSASGKAEAATRIIERGMGAVGRLVEVVAAIGRNGRQVNQITEVIAQIANRTHILSLNAAIEAARAGEHGKGFVVVAQEVGKLAESAAQNARQIADIVEQAGRDALQGETATGQVREAMETVATEAGETQVLIRSAAVGVEEQQAIIAQLDGTVGELRGIASSNAAASEEIAATMVELSTLATETRERVARYRTR